MMDPAPVSTMPSAYSLSYFEQMLDAQKGCVPCKLCGGKAVISDAGWGAGYYIRCENGEAYRAYMGCLIGDRRLGGWAYNVRDWWNRLHAIAIEARSGETPSGSTEGESAGPKDIARDAGA